MRHPNDRNGRFGPRGGGRGRAEEDVPAADGLDAWFTGRLPDGWFTEPPTITTDRDEILVVGKIEPPEAAGDPAAKAEAEAGRISRFREETREARMAIAR